VTGRPGIDLASSSRNSLPDAFRYLQRTRQYGIFQRLADRDGNIHRPDTHDGRIEVVEGMFLHQGGDFSADAEPPVRLVGYNQPARLADRGQDRVQVQRHGAA
jgi:hypothetical protein